MDRNFVVNMSLHQRFLLALTLILLLFGLVAHSVPTSLCECATAPRKQSGVSNPDLCPVCQLQTGTHQPQFSAILHPDISVYMGDQHALNPLECIFPVLQPPIA